MVVKTNTIQPLMPKTMKRQMAKNLVLPKKTMNKKTTWPSSRSKKRRKSNSASKLKKSERNRSWLRSSAVPNSLKLNVCALRLKLLKSRLVDKLLMRRISFARPKKTMRWRGCATCKQLGPVSPKKRKKPN